MQANRTRNGIVFNLDEFALTTFSPQPITLAKEDPHDDHHHYRL
jgi:hypothetical protein